MIVGEIVNKLKGKFVPFCSVFLSFIFPIRVSAQTDLFFSEINEYDFERIYTWINMEDKILTICEKNPFDVLSNWQVYPVDDTLYDRIQEFLTDIRNEELKNIECKPNDTSLYLELYEKDSVMQSYGCSWHVYETSFCCYYMIMELLKEKRESGVYYTSSKRTESFELGYYYNDIGSILNIFKLNLWMHQCESVWITTDQVPMSFKQKYDIIYPFGYSHKPQFESAYLGQDGYLFLESTEGIFYRIDEVFPY